MKTKSLTFLLALTFLFLFSGSVYGQKTEVKEFVKKWDIKEDHYDNGNLKSQKFYFEGKLTKEKRYLKEKFSVDPIGLTEYYKNDQNDNPIPALDSKLPIEFQRGPMTKGVLLDGTQIPDLSKFQLGLMSPLTNIK